MFDKRDVDGSPGEKISRQRCEKLREWRQHESLLTVLPGTECPLRPKFTQVRSRKGYDENLVARLIGQHSARQLNLSASYAKPVKNCGQPGKAPRLGYQDCSHSILGSSETYRVRRRCWISSLTLPWINVNGDWCSGGRLKLSIHDNPPGDRVGCVTGPITPVSRLSKSIACSKASSIFDRLD
jgi:hypothetical protein